MFGDGDPNADYEARRWAMVGQLIQARGGVVAAEELAPYLDVTPAALAASAEGGFVDEGYVVPALVRFGGQPEVGPDGELLYRFPSLQRTARAQARTCSYCQGPTHPALIFCTAPCPKGELLYRFPSLQRTVHAQVRNPHLAQGPTHPAQIAPCSERRHCQAEVLLLSSLSCMSAAAWQ